MVGEPRPKKPRARRAGSARQRSWSRPLRGWRRAGRSAGAARGGPAPRLDARSPRSTGEECGG
eukprot:6547803-Pyramimonas_sp.AAC.1